MNKDFDLIQKEIQMSEKKKYHRGRRRSSVKSAGGKDKETRRKENQHLVKENSTKEKNVSFELDRLGKIVGTVLIVLFVVFSVQMASAKGDSTAEIIIAAESFEIFKDDAVPEPRVVVECPKEQQEVILDKDTGFRVKDLIEMLNRKEGYEIVYDADGTSEGKYDIKIVLTDTLNNNLKNIYVKKVYLTTYDGVLTVKNKTGSWDGKKFKKYDGSYAKSEFVESKGEMYYFDEEGEMVTGWDKINGNTYHFTEQGVMEHDKWKKRKKGKVYLSENGMVATGWADIDDELYYFDENGIVLTGKHTIGASRCKFDDDGKLLSKECTLDLSKPMIALTFDDGPGERTMEILDVLEKYDAHATFFMQGKNVSSHKKEIRKMYDIGCELGNHSYDHPQFSQCSDGGANQVGETNSLIKEACGHSATVLRPPYRDYNDYVSASVGMPMILWNVDTLDWKTMNMQSTIDNVLNQADDGDIVLMHDVHDPTVDAVIKLIPKLISMDYQLVTVTELADARDIILQNGVAYTDFNQ